ncbi:MAG: hypothetical protein EXS17_07750 [Phycisphaerales bacterium]|nr:hypothetical protein [Phycisphaerales bacterium]
MRPSAPIISSLFLLYVAFGSGSGCSSAPANILDSDIPNVAGMNPIVTRDIVRRDGQIVGVNIIYRGDVIDCQINARDTKRAFDDQGWWFIDEQARGTTTVLNFGKEQRRARIDIAENQIDPMMSPAILRVSLVGGAGDSSAKAQNQPGGGTQPSIGPEGFAPPSE